MIEYRKIPVEKYVDFLSDYHTNNPKISFGSAFLEKFFPGLRDAELSDANFRDAIGIIMDKYIYFGVGFPEFEVNDDPQ